MILNIKFYLIEHSKPSLLSYYNIHISPVSWQRYIGIPQEISMKIWKLILDIYMTGIAGISTRLRNTLERKEWIYFITFNA